MGFKDLAERYDPALQLPIHGKTYRINPLDADTGLFLQTTTAIAMKISAGGDVSEEDVAQVHLDEDGPDIMTRVLGDTYEQLKADKVDWEIIKLVVSTVIIWATQDRDTAEEFWNNGGTLNPKGRKKPADRKASAKSARQGSPATTNPKPKKKPATPGI